MSDQPSTPAAESFAAAQAPAAAAPRSAPQLPAAAQAQAASQVEEIELPPLQDAILSPQKLIELLGDIEQAAELLEVRVKSRAQGHSTASGAGLNDVPPALAGGFAVQLRYRHAKQTWMDTLMPHPHGIRLVRIQC